MITEPNTITKNQFTVKKYVPKKRFVVQNINPVKPVTKRTRKVREPEERQVVLETKPFIYEEIPSQVEEVDKIVECYEKYPFYMETGRPGAGKTSIGFLTAQRLGLPVVLVAPAKLMPKWHNQAKGMGVEIVYSITYGKLSGETREGGYNTILSREDIRGAKIKTIYTPTDEYVNMLMKGVLLIFDECSMFKNRLAKQTKACRAISRKLTYLFGTTENFKSRTLFISGTPTTEIIQIVDFIKTAGYITSDKYFKIVKDKGVRRIEFSGMKPLIDVCSQIDKQQTDFIINHIYEDQSSINVTKIIVSLYVEILKHEVSGGIKVENIGGYKFDVKNKFYKMEPNDFENLKESIEELVEHTGYDDESCSFKKDGIKNRKMGAKPLRKKVNQGKIPILIKECKRVFDKYDKMKIIISTEYVSDITNVLKSKLRQYGAEVIEGSVPLSERERIIDLFNEGNDICKVLIISRCGFHGIDINHKVGDYPHRMYVLPDFSMENQYQGTHRGYRHGQKSDFKVRIVFAKGLDIELRIIESLERQSGCTKLMLDKNTIDNSVFPDDYEDKIEGEKKSVNLKIKKKSSKFETFSMYKN